MYEIFVSKLIFIFDASDVAYITWCESHLWWEKWITIPNSYGMHGLSGSIFTMTWLVIETNKTIHECTLDVMLCTIIDILVSFAQSIVRTNLSDRQLNKIMHAKTWCLLLLALTISVADRASVAKSTNSTIGSMFVADHYPFLTGHLGFLTFNSVSFIDWYQKHCIVL